MELVRLYRAAHAFAADCRPSPRCTHCSSISPYHLPLSQCPLHWQEEEDADDEEEDEEEEEEGIAIAFSGGTHTMNGTKRRKYYHNVSRSDNPRSGCTNN